MRKKIWLKNLLIAVSVMVITTCVNTSLEAKVQAASLPHPMPISKIFPDRALANEVKRSFKKASIKDLISQRELDEVQEFNANGLNIKSIEGLQYFTFLKELYLFHNQVSDLSPLKNLTNLNLLCANDNKLKNLNGLPSTKLTRLHVDDNELTDADSLAHLTQLEVLTIRKNKLRNIDALAHLSKLKILDLRYNELRDVSALGALKEVMRAVLACQKCVNEPAEYQSKVIIPNNIRNTEGVLITPYFISDDGEYIEGHVVWNLPAYTKEVNYTFGQNVKVGKTETLFNGVVEQPLYSKTPESWYRGCLPKRTR
ncbi:leucine-rich repeat domain-containing protein [Listeria ivanovii subsp. londoniensis]|uniref:leucine-rich repeat domain-containing protein n=1 Tax=Listeria ivanovii TaxID=1638 RepID=UPI001905B6CB|nr:leucine-rich repeat domain-containing protein [Listeria ivanovii]MBK2003013.1 leucine-rich repeat domain-containing protein [Listeria ivanovii subsp. londoniensis]